MGGAEVDRESKGGDAQMRGFMRRTRILCCKGMYEIRGVQACVEGY